MIEYLRQYACDHIESLCGDGSRLVTLIAIGSLAYPEFARPDSDIDLIAIYAGDSPSCDRLKLDVVTIGEVARLVELRIMSSENFLAYVLSCDVAKLFAFVRGYKILFNEEELGAAKIIEIAISRYYSDAARMYADMLEIGLDAHVKDMRFLMTDARNTLLSEGLRRQPLLERFRIGEVTKDFVTLIWTAIILKKWSGVELLEVDARSPILREVGLLTVFMAIRGGRIVDREKYPKPSEINSVLDRIQSVCTGGIEELLAEFEAVFESLFNSKLYLFNTKKKTRTGSDTWVTSA